MRRPRVRLPSSPPDTSSDGRPSYVGAEVEVGWPAPRAVARLLPEMNKVGRPLVLAPDGPATHTEATPSAPMSRPDREQILLASLQFGRPFRPDRRFRREAARASMLAH